MCHHLMPPNFPEGIPKWMGGVVIKAFYRCFDVGWWGVDLFFVLSGFLITGILLEAKGSAHYFGNFYARRTLRIFPLYYGVLALLFFVLPWLAATPATSALTQRCAGDLLAISRAAAPQQSWLWLYGTNIRMALAGHGWFFGQLSHFWSLAVEEHFYLIWPVVVWCCSTRALARVCLGVAAASLLCRAAFLAGGLAPECIYVLSPCRFDGLALGGFVAALTQLWRNGAAVAPAAKLNIWRSIRLLIGIQPPAEASHELLHAAFSRVFLFLLPLTVLVLLACPHFGWFVVVVGRLLFAVTFAAALPGAASVQRSSALLRGGWLCLPPLQILGKYSYGLYVIHPLLIQPLGKLLATPGIQSVFGSSYALMGVLRLALAIPVSLLIAWLVWHGFESHFLRLKRFFPADGPSRSVRENASLRLAPTTSSSE
jgi:peptidoglycan/LPS O-acetylase OafA/YrhL